MNVQRVGIMTGGGDCPGLNAVIRAAVLVGTQHYGWRMLGIEDAFAGLLDLGYRSPRGNRELDASDVAEIVARGGTILGTSNRCDPFRLPVRRDGATVEEDRSAAVIANANELGLDALITIGGDGTLAIAQRMADLGLRLVGVPKSIDNDLASTDYTFGFESAVQVATEALDRLRDTADSHDRVMLLEVMGRHAGFIALHAGIAGGAHAILLPEMPYSVDTLARFVNERRAVGRNYTLIVVAEGARPEGGQESMLAARPGEMPRLMGAGVRLEHELASRVEQETRVTVLGHLQRGGSPSSFDRMLATRFGEAAAHLVARGEFRKMVALRTPDIVAVPISEALARPKRVDPNDALVRTARTLGISFGERASA